MASIDEQKQFIIEYLKEHGCANVVMTHFHDTFHEKFGGKRKETLWGAMPVYKAQRLLGHMESEGILSRYLISMERRAGFSTWVYDYMLNHNFCTNCGELGDCVCDCFICGGDEMLTSADGHRFPCPNCQSE